MRFWILCMLVVVSNAFSAEGGNAPAYAQKTHTRNKTFKILALDGGGVRGVFSLKLIAMLNDEIPFLQNVDFFAGTSTGAMGAVALAYGLDPHKMVELYRENGHLIFAPYCEWVNPLWLRPWYESQSLKKFLQTIIRADLTLSDLPKKALCVAYQLYNPEMGSWSPCMLDNFNYEEGKKLTLLDAILRSGAAPCYFPSYQGYIDGGLLANNPSMAALSRALDKEGGNQPLENVRLFSVGTGHNGNHIEGDVEWGLSQWIFPYETPPVPKSPLLELLMDGTISIPHYQSKQILGCHYYRLDKNFDELPKLDDCTQINAIIEAAEKFPTTDPEKWAELKQWIRENFLDDQE